MLLSDPFNSAQLKMNMKLTILDTVYLHKNMIHFFFLLLIKTAWQPPSKHTRHKQSVTLVKNIFVMEGGSSAIKATSQNG